MPLTFTGAPDVIADLERVYRNAVAPDMAASSRDGDEIRAAAEMVALAEGEASSWARAARLGTSHGIWLDQHARDRGLSRQGGELDAVLIPRLRTSPRAAVYEPVVDAIQAVIDTADPSAVWYLVLIPLDVGAFADVDCFCDADSRVTPTRTRVVVALIPAALGVASSVREAMRSKMPVGTLHRVEEF